jgi:hypothetical protein
MSLMVDATAKKINEVIDEAGATGKLTALAGLAIAYGLTDIGSSIGGVSQAIEKLSRQVGVFSDTVRHKQFYDPRSR